MGHATAVSRVGRSKMSSKVRQHAGKPKLPQHSCEEFHQIPETCMRKPGVSASVSAAKKGHTPFPVGYYKVMSMAPKFNYNRK